MLQVRDEGILLTLFSSYSAGQGGGGSGKDSHLRKASCGDTARSIQECGCFLQIPKRLDSLLLMMSGTQTPTEDTPVQTGSLREWDMS